MQKIKNLLNWNNLLQYYFISHLQISKVKLKRANFSVKVYDLILPNLASKTNKQLAHCKILFCNKANRNSNWTFDVTSIINSKQNAQRTSDACHMYTNTYYNTYKHF